MSAVHRKLRPRVRMTARRAVAATESLRPQGGRKRVTASLVISIVAIVISALSFGVPFLERYVTQHGSAETYLAHLAQRGISDAEYFAEEGSPAHEFAAYIRLIEYAAIDDPFDYPNGKAVTNPSGVFEGPRFNLCFPERDILPLGCGEARAFEYSPTGKVTDFIWNGLPASAMMNLNERPMQYNYVDVPSLTIESTAALRGPAAKLPAESHSGADGIQLLRLLFDGREVDTVEVVSVELRDDVNEPLETAWRHNGGLGGYLAVAGDSDFARKIVVCFETTSQTVVENRCVSLPAAW